MLKFYSLIVAMLGFFPAAFAIVNQAALIVA